MSIATTWLFVPGTRPDRFSRAAASGAGEIIIDLEDAVAAEHKPAARQAAADWLAADGIGWVRVNAPGTPWYDDDVTALAGVPGLRGIMVPKAEDPGALTALAERLGGRGVVALIETARGLHRTHDIAAAAGVRRLAFGAIDFAVDIGAAETDTALLFARCTLVLASRVAGLPAPVDGVTVEVRDTAAVTASARSARELGFGAKLCIHPAQIPPAAAAFRPGEDEIAWARTVADAGAVASGAVQVDGQMVDEPVLARARRILELATP